MNPKIYSGTKNTADALKEEQAIAQRQGTQIPSFNNAPAPQPPDMTPSWAKSSISNTSASPSEAYGLNDVEMARYNETKSGSLAPQKTEEEIFNETLRRYQGEIDATNNIFASKLRDASVAGMNRSGSQYAQQARGGLLGSDFGNAQDERVNQYNTAVTNDLRDEQSLAIASILGKARSGAKEELAAKKAARDNDYAAYKELLTTSASRKSAKTNAYANELLAKGTTLEKLLGLDPTEFSGTGLSKQEVINAFKDAQLAQDKIKFDNTKTQAEINKINADILRGNQFDLSEGQARYTIDPTTGQAILIASRNKTYAPKSGGSGMSGGVGLINGKPVSSAAQNILNIMNASGGSVDDYVKGSSNAAQALRNEVYSALSNQGGTTKTTQSILTEGKSIVDDLLDTNGYKALGGYSTILGGQLGTGYGDASAKATQLSSILAKDNLGLLKGAMSDKDLAFIQSMSTGFDGQGIQSENYIKNRLVEIQKKLANKLATTPQQSPVNTQQAPAIGQTSSGIKYKITN